MTLVDQLLNLACVLLWLNWRAQKFDPLIRAIPSTLAGTLRGTEPKRLRGLQFFLSLILLLVLRAVVYWQIGPSAGWVPKLNLTFVALPFRSDNLTLCLFFSALSFGRALLALYVWLLALGLINRGKIDAGPLQKLVRSQLGRVGAWPWPVQVLLPFVLTTSLWLLVHPLLLNLNVTNRPHAFTHLIEQGILIGVAIVFSLKYLITSLLALYIITTYVYLGSNPIWDFVTGTSRNLLAPLSRLPLTVGRVDLAPVMGLILTVGLLHFVPELSLQGMLRRNVVIWPQ